MAECEGCRCPTQQCACAFMRPKRPRGRPLLEDKRKPRGGFNDAEWAKVKASAAAAGMTAAAWVRMRCGV